MSTSVELALAAAAVSAGSGLPGLLMGRASRAGQLLALVLLCSGGVGLAAAAGAVLVGGGASTLDLPWLLPWGRLAVRLDALGALFLLPVAVVPALGSIYGWSYWPANRQAGARRLQLFYGLLAGAMSVVVLAQDAILFLVAWEAMAIAAFFLITTEDADEKARQAGWVYFVAAHLGTLCLLPMFGLLAGAGGSFAIAPLAGPAPGAAISTAIFLLALAGFGLKAGLIPLHVWLPAAHACAPSHVSAALSGVMIKMGIYGLLRVLSVLPETPPWWGGTLLALGAISGAGGILYAIGQRDLKRVLAYSSIENIGIVLMGIGIAVLGRAIDEPAWVALGLAGALLHVWNHALFKGLLFLAAGSVVHATGTRQIDSLGGLAARMPRTAALFTVGAVAICGLPPLNGFFGEFLIYLGLLQTLGLEGSPPWRWAPFAAPVLAMIGGLAVLCFVRVYGAVFLGTARSSGAAGAHEAPASMIGAMAVPAVACAAIGLAPLLVLAPLNRAVAAWCGDRVGAIDLRGLVPAFGLGAAAVALMALSAIAMAAAWPRCRRARQERPVPTWDCGFAAPTPRIQYTASSFGQMLVALFRWALWPRQHVTRAAGRFPGAGTSALGTSVPDLVLDRAVLPLVRAAATVLPWVRLLQQGRVQVYVLYILLMVLVLLMWGPEPAP